MRSGHKSGAIHSTTSAYTPVVTGKREKGCFTMNESGSESGVNVLSNVGLDRANEGARIISGRGGKGWRGHLLFSYFATSIDLPSSPSILSFFFLSFFFSLHFRFSDDRNEARYLLGCAHLSVRSRTHGRSPLPLLDAEEMERWKRDGKRGD